MKQNRTQTSLQTKFTGLVLYNSLLATVLLVVVFALWRYQFSVNTHQQRIDALSPQHLTGIENSLWLMDNLQTHRQLKELQLILNIDYAEIELEGKKIAAVGISVPSPLISKNIKITRTEAGKTFELGTLHLHLDRHSIISSLMDELLPLLAIALLAIITPAIIYHYYMKKLITGRLVNIVNSLNHSGGENNLREQLEAINTGQSFDEIDRLSEEICNFHQINSALTDNLQQQQHYLNAIFNNTLSLLVLINSDGNIVNVNQSAIHLSQVEKHQLLDMPFWEPLWQHLNNTHRGQIQSLTMAALKGSLIREEINMTSGSNQKILDFSFIPIINDSEVEYVLIEAVDVTQIRLWETQQDIQVKLLKYFLSENKLHKVMNKTVESINELLPPGIKLHLFQENNRKNGMELLAGGLNNSTENHSFQQVIASTLKADFPLNTTTTISFNNKGLQLPAAIQNIVELLDFKQLYIDPVNLINNRVEQVKIFSIITIDKGQEISNFVKQLCSICSSLTEMAINREFQFNQTIEVEQNLGKVVNSSLDGILVLDDSAQVIQANDVFASLIGKTKQNITGKDFWTLPVSTSKPEILALINSTRVSGKQRYQMTLKENDDKRYCDLTLVSIGDKQQQFYAFFQDRTQQQLLINELEEQYQFIKAVLDNTSDAILACDENGEITLYNQRVNRLLNTSSSNIQGNEWSRLYKLFKEDGVTQLKENEYPLNIALVEGKVENSLIMAKSQSNATLHLICNGRRLYSSTGKTIGAVVTAHDVTSEYKAKLDLEKHQKHLEQQVAIRTEDLLQANKELEAFSYSVSHDLRAPLRSINGFAEILFEDYSGLISNSGQDLLQRIMKNASYLGNLIEDLLTLSKISQKEMCFDTINLSEICDILLEQEHINHAAIKYSISKNLSTKGDVGLIKIMMQNLLSNAVKYSKHSNPATIKLSAKMMGNKQWFILEDNGVGFNNKFKEKIFKPFQRAHGDEYEGNGIGLSIVQRIIERHQGEIRLSSEINKGTTVEFHIPEFFES